ncbi:hypothetical protein [Nocardioides sp. R-C-SC26]|uniref:hypothetical protein n=1 Tax=Nocardioides sp. R-C-SC26 TaxID=2870414 RepID=UPI001E316321|nr:hypothetical protein [Nocardioides sp. R-C-SC26]
MSNLGTETEPKPLIDPELLAQIDANSLRAVSSSEETTHALNARHDRTVMLSMENKIRAEQILVLRRQIEGLQAERDRLAARVAEFEAPEVQDALAEPEPTVTHEVVDQPEQAPEIEQP